MWNSFCCVLRYTILMMLILLNIGLIFLITANAKDLKHVIVDVDGGIDDFQALVTLLNADKRHEIKLEAIFTTPGITDTVHIQKNVLRLLETIGRTDIPIYAGADSSILDNGTPHRWYGEDGFADLDYKSEPNMKLVQKQIIPTFLNDIIMENPGKVSLVVLGPLTNLALSLRLYPNISMDVKELLIMGGKIGETEYNFLADPEAAQIVLSTMKCPIKMYTGQYCSIPSLTLNWRLSLELSNPVWNLYDRAEKAVLNTTLINEQYYANCDTQVALVFIYPESILGRSSYYVTIDLRSEKRSQMIIDETVGLQPNVELIEGINVDFFKVSFTKEFEDLCKNYECTDIFI